MPMVAQRPEAAPALTPSWHHDRIIIKGKGRARGQTFSHAPRPSLAVTLASRPTSWGHPTRALSPTELADNEPSSADAPSESPSPSPHPKDKPEATRGPAAQSVTSGGAATLAATATAQAQARAPGAGFLPSENIRHSGGSVSVSLRSQSLLTASERPLSELTIPSSIVASITPPPSGLDSASGSALGSASSHGLNATGLSALNDADTVEKDDLYDCFFFSVVSDAGTSYLTPNGYVGETKHTNHVTCPALTPHAPSAEPEFQRTFLGFYRTFATPDELLRELGARWEALAHADSCAPGATASSSGAAVSMARLAQFLLHWTQTYPVDLASTLYAPLAERISAHSSTPPHVRFLLTAFVPPAAQTWGPLRLPPAPEVFTSEADTHLLRATGAFIADQPASTVAAALTARAVALLAPLNARDIAWYLCTGGTGRAYRVREYEHRLAAWIGGLVLAQARSRARTRVANTLTALAAALAGARDEFSLHCLRAGLAFEPVARIQAVKTALAKRPLPPSIPATDPACGCVPSPVVLQRIVALGPLAAGPDNSRIHWSRVRTLATACEDLCSSVPLQPPSPPPLAPTPAARPPASASASSPASPAHVPTGAAPAPEPLVKQSSAATAGGGVVEVDAILGHVPGMSIGTLWAHSLDIEPERPLRPAGSNSNSNSIGSSSIGTGTGTGSGAGAGAGKSAGRPARVPAALDSLNLFAKWTAH